MWWNININQREVESIPSYHSYLIVFINDNRDFNVNMALWIYLIISILKDYYFMPPMLQ